MTVSSRENRSLRVQAGIIAATFKHNGFRRALTLLWPVFARRIREVMSSWLTPLKFASPRLRIMRGFVKRMLPKPGARAPTSMGNYCAFPDLLTADSVVYSFGVGGDIRFDLALSEASPCSVHLFDPTPRSIRFMEGYSDSPRLAFHPWGIWTTDGPVRFFSDVTLVTGADGDPMHDYRSGSITNITGSDNWFEAECFTLPSIMRQLEHDHVDLLKMDIEGAALEVMEHLLSTDIRPSQIIVEFEAPRENTHLGPFLERIGRIVERLKADGYDLWPLDRGRFHTDSVELFAARL